ncbi:MAG TPA: hypothetical protein VI703_11115, partial [Anaerolineales bacterium]|nr:hypothetical protein [Anaerolineales bacterium]
NGSSPCGVQAESNASAARMSSAGLRLCIRRLSHDSQISLWVYLPQIVFFVPEPNVQPLDLRRNFLTLSK